MLVNDDSFAARPAQPSGQTKVDMAPGGAFALDHARQERDVVAGGHCDLARYEADRVKRICEEKCQVLSYASRPLTVPGKSNINRSLE